MFNKIQYNLSSFIDPNYVEPHENPEKTADKKLNYTPMDEASTSASSNQCLTLELAQRTVAPVHIQLTDLITQKIENEINKSPLCKVFFIPDGSDIYSKIRFTEVTKNNMYQKEISLEEIENAIKLSDGKCKIKDSELCNYERYYYVENLKINRYLVDSFPSLNGCYSNEQNLRVSGIFEGYDSKETKWKMINTINSGEVHEVLLNHRYIQIKNNVALDFDGYRYLKANKEKFIADKITQHFSEAINIFIQELYSEKQPEKKVENLQGFIYPDLMLLDEISQKITPHLSAKSFLERIQFAPYSRKYQSLVENNPKYRKDTI